MKYAKATAKKSGRRLGKMAYKGNPLIQGLAKGGIAGKGLAIGLLGIGALSGGLLTSDDDDN